MQRQRARSAHVQPDNENKQNQASSMLRFPRPETARNPSQKHWENESKKSSARNVGNNALNQNLNMLNIPVKAPYLQSLDREYQLRKPYQFLSTLGGTQLTTRTLSGQSDISTALSRQLTIITDTNLDRPLMGSRPLSSKSTQQFSIRKIQNARIQSARPQKATSRPLTSSAKDERKATSFRPKSAIVNINEEMGSNKQPLKELPEDFSYSDIEEIQDAEEQEPFQAYYQQIQQSKAVQSKQVEGKIGSARPISAKPPSTRPPSHYKTYQNVQNQRPPSQYSQNKRSQTASRPTSSRPQTAESRGWTAQMQQGNANEQQPEIFDRTVETRAANFQAGAHTPVQRIATFMSFTARLTKEQLIAIISKKGTINPSVKIENEDPEVKFTRQFTDRNINNPAISNLGLKYIAPNISAHRTPGALVLALPFSYNKQAQQTLNAQNTQNQDLNALFEQQNQELQQSQQHQILDLDILYEPNSLGLFIDEIARQEQWDESICRIVQTSWNRYNYYLENEQHIKNEDLSPYNKQWITNALKLIPAYILKNSDVQIRQLFQQVFSIYIKTARKIILDYVLRSSAERQRLQIVALPRQQQTSSDRIAHAGGYTRAVYVNWCTDVRDAKQSLKKTLINCNIICSALQDWNYDFQRINIFDIVTLKDSSIIMSPQQFLQHQRNYMISVREFMINIWYRGCVLIMKKAKYLRKKWLKKGYFTLKGFHEQPPFSRELNNELWQQYYIRLVTVKPERSFQYDTYTADQPFQVSRIEDIDGQDYAENYAQIMEVLQGKPEPILIQEFMETTLEECVDIKPGLQIPPETERKKIEFAGSIQLSLFLRNLCTNSIDSLVNILTNVLSYNEMLQFKYQNESQASIGSRVPSEARSPIPKEVQQEEKKQSAHQKDIWHSEIPEKINIPEDLLFNSEIVPLFKIQLELRENIIQIANEDYIDQLCELLAEAVKMVNEFPHIECVDLKGMQLEEKQGIEQIELENRSDGRKVLRRLILNKQMKVIENGEVIHNLSALDQRLNIHKQEARQQGKLFEPFNKLIFREYDENIRAFLKQDRDLREFQIVLKHLAALNTLLDTVPGFVNLPFFMVDLTLVISELKLRLKTLRHVIYQKCEGHASTTLLDLQTKYSDMQKYLMQDTLTVKSVVDMELYKQQCYSNNATYSRQADESLRKLLFLSDKTPVNERTLQMCYEVKRWPKKMHEILDFMEDKHRTQRVNLEEQVRGNQKAFEVKLEGLQEEVRELSLEVANHEKNLATVIHLQEYIEQLRTELIQINEYEEMLFNMVSPFTEFTVIEKEFIVYANLWKQYSSFRDFRKNILFTPLIQLNVEEAEGIAMEHIKNVAKLNRDLEGKPSAQQVIEGYKFESQDVYKKLPVLRAVGQDGLKERHWNQIKNLLGCEFDIEQVSLQEILNMDVQKALPKIEEIAENAGKELLLEKGLQKMQDEWENLELTIKQWRDSVIQIVEGFDDLQALLDDHLVKAQIVRRSPFIGPHQRRAEEWESTLTFIQAATDLWGKVQSKYLFLWPLFQSQDIKKQLPHETVEFQQVDSLWKILIGNIKQDPKVLSLPKISSFLSNLEICLQHEESISQSLYNYLEAKRLLFPRFFFLSNGEVLEILSESRNPLRVQPYIQRCFEGVSSLEFSENTEITHLVSSLGEQLPLVNTIQPLTYAHVELWLTELEQQMKQSMIQLSKDSLFDLLSTKTPRSQWATKWAGQLVLTISRVQWTTDVEQALSTSTLGLLLQKIQRELQDVVEIVRGELSEVLRLTLGALIVLDVHAKDVTEEIKQENSTLTGFEWLSQLRYYYEKEVVNVSMLNCTFPYENEYLGNTTRLVITPLTDRCYRTLVQAINLNLGGAPEGPAGTGKTETVKDLAKAFGQACVVFNCSEALDNVSMAKFFKGLASAGAWSCFDEFNRIDLEVLSVIASQILVIQQAKAANRTDFLFEGTRLKLMKQCNAFITMNPEYAGRSQLPDNLKALFRPVAMMVPDYCLITEILLYSYGFVEARKLAKKVVATYKLCSEQLSTQSHYDYGMRAVKAVVSSAGVLKAKFPDASESLLLLRSINDVNMPKFLKHDLPLFEGIVQDLFPGTTLQPIYYAGLFEAMEARCAEMKVVKTKYLEQKAIQIFETQQVRHGLMLVGPAGTGKSTALNLLVKSLSSEICQIYKKPTFIVSINPKAITLKQLYGKLDPTTLAWTDGVLSRQFRLCAQNCVKGNQWLLFDGPVDALWIESMNTALDDNKKLCLSSGETISMPVEMRLVYQVDNLEQASPATVSRCGMIYFPLQGWEFLLNYWLNPVQKDMTSAFEANNEWKTQMDQISKQYLQELSKAFLPPLFQAVYSKKQFVQVPEPALAHEFLRLYSALYTTLLSEKVNQVLNLPSSQEPTIQPENSKLRMEMVFLYAAVWSIGSRLDEQGQHSFSSTLIKLCKEKIQRQSYGQNIVIQIDSKALFPDAYQGLKDPSPFDFALLPTLKWIAWKNLIPVFKPPNDAVFHQLTIPTTRTVKGNFIMHCAIENQLQIMITGPTGTGKSLYTGFYLRGLNSENYQTLMMSFSAQTAANTIQDIVDNSVQTRKRHVFGPQLGKLFVIFVDDLNLPAAEEYGAQPAVELLRQFLDQGGWYDRKDYNFKSFIDTLLIAAMAPAGGARIEVSQRFSRHFNVIGNTEFDGQVLERICSGLIQWHVDKYKFDESIQRQFENSVQASINLYQEVQQTLLPLPAKSHYQFNLRDLCRVMQGISMMTRISQRETVVRLWIHEVSRVFQDRLISEKDQKIFQNIMLKITKREMKEEIDPEFLDRILFGDVTQPGSSCIERDYVELTSIHPEELQARIQDFLNEYNSTSRKPLDLVLFQSAIQHLLRICRVLKFPLGNCLLVGVGGSGRKSLCTLATHIAGYATFNIEMSQTYGKDQWREDMQNLIQKCGVDGLTQMCIFTDTQLTKDYQYEDVNSLLNDGAIPNLFNQDDQIQLQEKLRPIARREGLSQLSQSGTLSQFESFLQNRVKKAIHICLCLSPAGENFKSKIRQFPALLNCCNVDWFFEWPLDALLAVANNYLADVHNKDKISNVASSIHQSVKDLSSQLYQKRRQYFYVTPTSYIELLKLYIILKDKKMIEIQQNKQGYEKGLEKLEFTKQEVLQMQKELEEKKPMLIQTTHEIETMTARIEKEIQEVVEPKKKQISIEEAQANEKAQISESIKNECEADLSAAMPKLQAAIDALNTLTPSDIVLVRSMLNPPAPVKRVMEAVCVMCQKPPMKVPSKDNPKIKVDDYWETSKKFLANHRTFLDELISFDRDNIPEPIIEKIRKNYISHHEFNPQRVEKASSAAAGICKWLLAIEDYDKVAKYVRPKKQKFMEAESEWQELDQNLKLKQAELAEVMSQLKSLQDELDRNKEFKEMLEKDINDCTVKLERAETLISGLGGEYDRWLNTSTALESMMSVIGGDILISSAAIAYLGIFPQVFRSQAIKQWKGFLIKAQLPFSSNTELFTPLFDPVLARQWQLQGLPPDNFSCENAIIMTSTRRSPLLIDPQSIAIRWLKQKEEMLQILKPKGEWIRTLKGNISLGFITLLEIQDSVESILDPILLQQSFRSGGIPSVKIGDEIVTWGKGFQLFLLTKLKNPHFLPETCSKVCILNFGITVDGLEDQLLEKVVMKEKPELEEERTKLIQLSHANKKKLKEIEDEILKTLRETQENILEDESAIKILAQSKEISNEIMEKQVQSEQTQQKIEEARSHYQPTSKLAACLYFALEDLSQVHQMYQYSLNWFMQLFNQSLEKSEQSEFVNQRNDYIIDHFINNLFNNVCRSLFQKHKILFSLLITVSLMVLRKQLQKQEFLYVISILPSVTEKSKIKYLTDIAYCRLLYLQKEIPDLSQLVNDILSSPAKYEQILKSNDLYKQKFPIEISGIHKLCLIRSIAQEQLIQAIQYFIVENMGQQYIEFPPFDLEKSYLSSEFSTPLLFILPGTDPLQPLLKFSETYSKQDTIRPISLGRGQGKVAEKAIDEGRRRGFWILLQNCHLCPSWMPQLEDICEQMQSLKAQDTHPSFRLWLSSYESKDFPQSILMSAIKITNEPPLGLKANLQSCFATDPVNDMRFFSTHPKSFEFKKLLISLCTFHFVVQERTRYGPLGFCIPYHFTSADFKISVRQLHQFLAVSQEIPWKAISYLTKECNYGGRATDEHDRRTLSALLEEFYNPKVFQQKYKLMDVFLLPDQEMSFVDYRNWINQLPQQSGCDILGFHPNASITKAIQDQDELCMQLLNAYGGSKQEAQEQKQIQSQVEDILKELPDQFDTELAQEKYPHSYENSFNTLLVQELNRYNRLLNHMKLTLKQLLSAFEGTLGMSSQLEQIQKSLEMGLVPQNWLTYSYPSLKPLSSYIKDLIQRLQMFQLWITKTVPNNFWLPGFFFTQGFLTAVMQNYARAHKYPIDTVQFDFQISEIIPPNSTRVNGLYIEAARWYEESLAEPEDKVLFYNAPEIFLVPERGVQQGNRYACPVYKTQERRGELSTTGHSTNFVLDIFMPTSKNSQHWVKRGVAMLCQLSH